jgi:hypothetical protein
LSRPKRSRNEAIEPYEEEEEEEEEEEKEEEEAVSTSEQLSEDVRARSKHVAV